jgi:pyruvate formate lyase activating enzyme
MDPHIDAGGERCSACPHFGACARACPAEAIQQVGCRMTVAEVMEIIRQDRPFYEESGGGVTFTGGEPLAQPSFLIALLEACAAEGIHAAIETSGYAAPEIVLDAARRADLLLFDLKTADAVRGSAFTGVDYGLCLANLEAAARAKALDAGCAGVVVRMPIIPGQNDSEREIEEAADFVARLARAANGALRPGSDPLSVSLLPYHGSAKGKCRLWGIEYPLSETVAPDEAALEAAVDIFASRGLVARRGG